MAERAGVFGEGMEKVQQGIDYIKMTAEGMYFDSQVTRLGLNPNDPNIVAELQRRYQSINSMPLEEYVTRSPTNSTLSAATKKSSEERALKNALEYYSRKYGQNQAPQFDFFKR
jgi:hypothetical protein